MRTARNSSGTWNRTYAAGVMLAALGWLAPAALRAQAILSADQLNTETSVFWYDNQFFYHGSGFNFAQSPIQGHDWSDTRTSAYSNTGLTGDASASNNSAYNPSNPGVGGTFNSFSVQLDATANITASDLTGAHYFEDAYGWAGSTLVITLTQPTNWTWEADVQGACSTNGWDNNAYYWFRIYSSDNTVEYLDNRRRTSNGDNDYNEHISLSGTLPAGSFNIYIKTNAELANFSEVGGGTGSAHASLNGVFTVPEPSTAALLALGALALRRRR